MDPSTVLLWIVGITCANALLQAQGMRRKGLRPYTRPFVLLLLGTLVASTFGRPWSAYAVFVAFLAIVVFPAMASSRLQRLVHRGEFVRARRLASFLFRVRRGPTSAGELAVLEALALAQEGDLAGAEAHLARAVREDTPAGRAALVQLLALGARFEDLIGHLETRVPAPVLASEPALLVSYLRALGEVGRRGELFATYRRFAPVLERPGNAGVRDMARLVVLAFGGRTAAVTRLLRGPLDAYATPSGEAWLATAELASGGRDASRASFERLASAKDARVRSLARHRLEHWDEEPPPLRPADEHMLDVLEEAVATEERFGREGGSARPVLTYALVAANVVVFVFEKIYGEMRLFELGAMIPSFALRGQVYRLLTYEFLHAGEIHLLMNMLALYVIGRFVERSLGPIRTLLVFLFAGLAGSVASVVLLVTGVGHDVPLVGASGGIMGLVGAEAAVLLVGYLFEGVPMAKDRLRSIGMALLLQVVFDLSIPEVSFLAHSTGFVAGGALGILFAVARRFREGSRRRASH